jgi:7-cyano-7-deazaguanine reductase
MIDDVLNKNETLVADSELGKKSEYRDTYSPDQLFPISRAGKRLEIGVDPTKPPFHGFDCWNHYEVSWLNPKGKPVVAMAEIIYDANSPKLIESKSLKLYFNSFNNTHVNSVSQLQSTIERDIGERIQSPVLVKIQALSQITMKIQDSFAGECIDDLDIECSEYQVNPSFLSSSAQVIEEALYSDLLKSNCLVTHQPDWGSVQIKYRGPKINREGLLKYLISFRNHNEFHEQCIERIFVDVMQYCKPEQLTVYGRYTRRGGLDINPYRSTEKTLPDDKNIRLIRQ